MNPRDHVDPELLAPLDGLLEATGGGFNLNDIPATRAMLSAMLEAVKAELPEIDGVASKDLAVDGLDGAPDIAIRLYRPQEDVSTLPAVLWLHPGGFVLGDLELDDFMLRQLAKDTGCLLVNVSYRLAPENPFPAAFDDCYATLKWLHANAVELGVDPERIAVAGGSAGGGLAAATTLRARDTGEVPVAFQMLIYPALDDRNVAQASASLPDNLLWTRENALHSWTAYVGSDLGSHDLSPYAAPIRATDLGGLPPTYIAVGSLDMFLEENTLYARRLAQAGVATELHVYPGAYHAFDAFAPMASVSARFVNDRNGALIAALGT